MTHRLIDDQQVPILVLGGHAAVAAIALGWENYVTNAGRYFMPGVWPPVFGVGAVLAFLYAFRRTSRLLWRASGQWLLAAYTSRAYAFVISGMFDGWTAKVVLGVVTWGVFAYFVWRAWLRAVLPHEEPGP